MARARHVVPASWIVWLLSLALFACSGSTATPTEAPRPTAIASSPSAPPVVVEPAPAYTVVAEVRVANARQIIDLIGVPLHGKDVHDTAADLLGSGWLDVAADNTKLAAGIDLDGPLDFVIVSVGSDTNDLMSAVAVPIKSVDEANAALKGDGKCRAESTITGKARLVCSQSERENRALAPYMAKRDQAAASLVRVRINAAAFRETVGKIAREEMANLGSLVGTETKLGRTANSVIETLIAELRAELQDLETIEASLDKDASGGVHGELLVSFRSKKSWLASTLAKMPDPPVSAAYGALPRDRDASTSYGWPSKELTPVLEGARDILATVLDEIQMGTPAERERIASAVFLFGAFGSPIVTSRGFDPPRPLGAKATAAEKAVEATRMKEGWNVTWAPGKPEDVMRPYLEISELAALPSVKALLPTGGFGVKRGPGPRELGAGSKELSFVTGTTLDPNVKTTTYTILMPGHGGVWSAFGVDRPRLISLLKEVRASEDTKVAPAPRPGTPVVGSEPGLIAQESVRSMIFRFLMPEDPSALLDSTTLWKKVDKLPNKGKSEILLRGKSSAEPLKLSYKVTIPKEAVDDLSAFAKGLEL